MPIEVIKPGLSTTVQDRGREGYYHVGMPPSGALDQFSLVAANLLVGNPEGAAALECAYMGPELRFTEPAVVAVTGAELEPRVNGEAQPGWTSFAVEAGDSRHVRPPQGRRARLRRGGGRDRRAGGARQPLHLRPRRARRPGGPPAAGGRRAARSARARTGPRGARCPRTCARRCPTRWRVRVVMGLYDHLLTDDGRRTFLETTWKLTPVADRVGFRYKGEQLDMVKREQPFGAGSDPSNIVDAPYPIGSIQVPGGVEPIILHRDAVSGGGYAMIATVISADMDTVGQSAPGSKTRFVAVDLDAALAARHERREREDRLRAALA